MTNFQSGSSAIHMLFNNHSLYLFTYTLSTPQILPNLFITYSHPYHWGEIGYHAEQDIVPKKKISVF